MLRSYGRAHRRALTLAATVLTVGGLLATAAPANAAPSPSKIAITAMSSTSKSKVVKGDKLTLSGWTSANLRNQVLQAYVVRGKSTSALNISTRVNASSRYAITIPVNQNAGPVKYVLQFAGSRSLAKTQAVQGVNVWQWFPLTEQKIVGDKSFNPEVQQNVMVAGTRYSSAIANNWSLWGDQSGWSEWNLGYHCSTFSSKFGLTDESDSAGRSVLTVSTDGSNRYSTELSVGQVRSTWFDVSGSFRIRLAGQSTAKADSYPAFPVARVLCSSNPNPLS